MAQGIRTIPLGVRVRVQDIMVMLLWNYTFTSTLQGFASMLIRFLWSLSVLSSSSSSSSGARSFGRIEDKHVD